MKVARNSINLPTPAKPMNLALLYCNYCAVFIQYCGRLCGVIRCTLWCTYDPTLGVSKLCELQGCFISSTRMLNTYVAEEQE